MAIYSNITEYECDKCGAKMFAFPGDETVKLWSTPSRHNSLGDVSSCVLCPTCSKEYAELVAVHDKDFAEFLGGN